MKKMIHTLICALFAISAIGQIHLEPQVIDFFEDGMDISDPWLDLTIYFDVTNQFDQKVELKWVKEIEEPCISDWLFQCCDNYQCYPSHVDTNWDLALGLDSAYVLEAGETHEFAFHVWPKVKAGCCKGYVHFSTVQETDVILATAEINMKINDPNCLVSTKIAIREAINIFPNPFENVLQTTENQDVKKLEIFDITGQLVREYDAEGKTKFELDGLNSGTYLITLSDSENRIIKTERINKI